MNTEPVLQACDRCHRRKTRCDKRRPICVACEKANTQCTYSPKPKDLVPRREYVERLEKRARQLELNNRALEERISATGQVACTESSGLLSESPELTPQQSTIGSATLSPVNGDTRNRHEVASEVTFLSTHAGGGRQFLGPASGLFLANLVKTSAQQQNDEGGSSRGNELSKAANWGTDHNTIPPRQMAQSLIDAYLAHDALCYPIIHPKRIIAAVNTIYASSSHSSRSPFDRFLFNMLLAIATAQVYKFNWQVLPDAETHHQRAMAYLEPILRAGGMESLQAILLCCQFRLSSPTKDASGSLWHMVGIAARMCFELGLHRESSYPLKYPGTTMVEDALLSAWDHQEVRRQCFWCAACLDRVVSITLGRPLAIHAEDIDVELPWVHFEDENASPPSIDNLEPLRLAPGYRMVVFTHIIRYRNLCGKILTSLHRGSRSTAGQGTNRTSIRAQLFGELKAWRVDTALLRLPGMDLSTPLAEARSSFRSKAWYELLYQNAVLLLYRPSLSNENSDIQEDNDGIQKTYSSAKQSVTLYAYLFKSCKINFSWMTLNAVFLAGLSYVYALSQHLREKRRRRVGGSQASLRSLLSQDPGILDIVNDTRSCSNVLVAVCERCNAPKTCHEVFDRLSDAVLADAVELHTGAHQAPQHIQDHELYGAASSLQAVATAQAGTTGQSIPPGAGFSETDGLLTVESTLLDCIPELRYISEGSWVDDAIHQLSMDWLDGIDNENNFTIPPDAMQV